MNNHHDSFLNITLATVVMTMPWWIHAIEEFSWLAGKLLLPALGLVLVSLQVWYIIRKHKLLNQDGGKKSE
jgi:hypothetical protein